MPISQLLIETDVLADYLITPATHSSLLRSALQRYVCYTSVINALEVFRMSYSEDASVAARREDAVLSMLYLVRVLGFNARYAVPFAAIVAKAENNSNSILTTREAMILGLADASKLTLLTKANFERYTSFGIVPVIRELPIH